jgi:RHS repeat-associated protein
VRPASHLGSVRLVTDSTGATPATYAYAAFGSTRKSTGSLANEVRFSGERTDTESGLEFLRARTYDPSTGTFLQRDSWGITATSSQSLDAYAYTANNPINAVDPSGHCPACIVIVGIEVSPWVLGAIGTAAAWTGVQLGTHPQAANELVGAAYTVTSAPFGIAGDWGRAGVGWLQDSTGIGRESVFDKIREMAKAKSLPRVEPLWRDPTWTPPSPPDPDNPTPGGKNPFEPLGRIFKKALPWAAGLAVAVAPLLCAMTDLDFVCNGSRNPSATPTPSPTPSPTPTPSSMPRRGLPRME